MPHELVEAYEKRRTSAGVPQNVVLRRAGVSASTIWRWFQDNPSSPNLDTLSRLNAALDAILAERKDSE